MGIYIPKKLIIRVGSDKYIAFWKTACVPISKNRDNAKIFTTVRSVEKYINELRSVHIYITEQLTIEEK